VHGSCWMHTQWWFAPLLPPACPGWIAVLTAPHLTPPPHWQTVDQRRAEGHTPLWAERMNLSGGKQGPQSSTIYGYREEYKPSQKTDARSMVRAGC